MKPDLRDIHSIPAGKVDAVLDQIPVPDAYPHFTPFVENKKQVRADRRMRGVVCLLMTCVLRVYMRICTSVVWWVRGGASTMECTQVGMLSLWHAFAMHAHVRMSGEKV